MENKLVINNRPNVWSISGWIFGMMLLTVGILNMFLVHLVPGVAYLLLSFIYFPPSNAYIKKKFDFSIPLVVKIILAIFILLFTLGVSDLGDLID
jgi:hypothetical protein